MNLIIDIGNTVAKLAVFEGDELVEIVHSSNHSLDCLPLLCSKHAIQQGIMASVIKLTDTIRKQVAQLPFHLIELTYQTPIPIHNYYKTPQTLGMDRLAAVVGANYLKPGKNLLVIDAGTAITYEFINENAEYFGGNISPGVRLRFKALNTYCEKLPMTDAKGDLPEFGYDTPTAIRAGVLRGIEFEIKSYIQWMRERHPGLLVFLTGGDCFTFDTHLRSIIFTDKYIVLKGLNRILNYNNDKQ